LTLTGTFTLNEVHSWVGGCLANVSPRLNSEDSKLCFRSTFLKTVLYCDYCKGKAIFQSDSITTISILKEVMTKEATTKKIAINISLDLKQESVFTFLELLKPELDHHFALARRHALIEPLKEIQSHEDNISFLSADFHDIVKNADTIAAEFKVAPRHLDFLRGIVTDLYMDKLKLAGKRPNQQQIPQLLDILNNYKFSNLVSAFKESI